MLIQITAVIRVKKTEFLSLKLPLFVTSACKKSALTPEKVLEGLVGRGQDLGVMF